jgi:hypothetical protein
MVMIKLSEDDQDKAVAVFLWCRDRLREKGISLKEEHRKFLRNTRLDEHFTRNRCNLLGLISSTIIEELGLDKSDFDNEVAEIKRDGKQRRKEALKKPTDDEPLVGLLLDKWKWWQADHRDKRLFDADKCVIGFLYDKTRPERDWTDHSLKEIQRGTGLSTTTVKRVLNHLEWLDFFERERANDGVGGRTQRTRFKGLLARAAKRHAPTKAVSKTVVERQQLVEPGDDSELYIDPKTHAIRSKDDVRPREAKQGHGRASLTRNRATDGPVVEAEKGPHVGHLSTTTDQDITSEGHSARSAREPSDPDSFDEVEEHNHKPSPTSKAKRVRVRLDDDDLASLPMKEEVKVEERGSGNAIPPRRKSQSRLRARYTPSNWTEFFEVGCYDDPYAGFEGEALADQDPGRYDEELCFQVLGWENGRGLAHQPERMDVPMVKRSVDAFRQHLKVKGEKFPGYEKAKKQLKGWLSGEKKTQVHPRRHQADEDV